MKLELSQQIFEKRWNIKFHEKPSTEGRVVTCGRTDRHDDANSRFSQFYERACNIKLKIMVIILILITRR